MAYFRISGLAPHAAASKETSNVLEGYSAILDEDDSVSIGSMPNKGAVQITELPCDGVYTIPLGYHNGQGYIKTKSLASQTNNATAYADLIRKGKTAWINGNLITGKATFTIN